VQSHHQRVVTVCGFILGFVCVCAALQQAHVCTHVLCKAIIFCVWSCQYGLMCLSLACFPQRCEMSELSSLCGVLQEAWQRLAWMGQLPNLIFFALRLVSACVIVRTVAWRQCPAYLVPWKQ
jgi:hypothetical protein